MVPVHYSQGHAKSHRVMLARPGPSHPQAFSLPPCHPCAGTVRPVARCQPAAPPPSFCPGVRTSIRSLAVLSASLPRRPHPRHWGSHPGTTHLLMPPRPPSRSGGQSSHSPLTRRCHPLTWPMHLCTCSSGPSASGVVPQLCVRPLPLPALWGERVPLCWVTQAAEWELSCVFSVSFPTSGSEWIRTRDPVGRVS